MYNSCRCSAFWHVSLEITRKVNVHSLCCLRSLMPSSWGLLYMAVPGYITFLGVHSAVVSLCWTGCEGSTK